MSTRHLDALFNPKSIVILGASERSQNLGGIVLRNLLSSDYPGKLLILNPKGYQDVHGIPCVGKVSKMPFVPDLAIVCSPPETVPRMVKALGKAGVKTAMVLTGGYPAPTVKVEDPLMYSVRDAAKETGIRVLGPNTIGIMVPSSKLNATYAHMGVLPGKIAFIGQSGTIASAIIDWAFSRGIGFSHFLTLGDSMDIDPDDLIDYLSQDRNTKAILLHIEQIPNPNRFISAVRAASRAKLVIGVKSGRVPESQWTPARLPDGIVNNDIIFDALLRRAGVLRVNGTDEMFDALETLTRMKPVRKDKLAIICNGLGPGVLAVDRLAYLGGELATLSQDTVAALEKLLPPYWTHKNPVDLDYDASPELYRQTLQILAKDYDIANVLVMYAPSLTEDSLQIADAVITEARHSRLNIFTCWLGQSTVLDAREAFFEAGIPTYFTPEKAIKAYMHQVNHARSQALLRETPSSISAQLLDRSDARDIVCDAVWKGRRFLSGAESMRLLSDYGIPTIETWYCSTVEDVVAIFHEKGGPLNVAMMHEYTCHPFLEEKTGRGRYRNTLHRMNDEASIREACEQLIKVYEDHFSDAAFLGFAVHRSVTHIAGLGFSLGITRDPLFGPLIVCGAAGASVNVMSDRHVALPPLNMALAKDLLSQTYMYRLLKEFSHHPGKDITAVCEILVTLSQIVVDNPEIKGLEILPLLFNKDGAVAVDVAIDLGAPAKLIIQPYPEHLSELYVLPKSGRQVVLRPVRGEDEPTHVEFHSKLSPESIRFRFFHFRKSFTHDELVQMVQIDYDREMVFIASAPRVDGKPGEETLGVVRAWTDADNYQCEFAVIISDHLKGEGLGHKLMTKMISYCRERGTIEMIGSVLAENKPMQNLAKKLGFEVKWDPVEEVMSLRLPLNKDTRPGKRVTETLDNLFDAEDLPAV